MAVTYTIGQPYADINAAIAAAQADPSVISGTNQLQDVTIYVPKGAPVTIASTTVVQWTSNGFGLTICPVVGNEWPDPWPSGIALYPNAAVGALLNITCAQGFVIYHNNFTIRDMQILHLGRGAPSGGSNHTLFLSSSAIGPASFTRQRCFIVTDGETDRQNCLYVSNFNNDSAPGPVVMNDVNNLVVGLVPDANGWHDFNNVWSNSAGVEYHGTGCVFVQRIATPIGTGEQLTALGGGAQVNNKASTFTNCAFLGFGSWDINCTDQSGAASGIGCFTSAAAFYSPGIAGTTGVSAAQCFVLNNWTDFTPLSTSPLLAAGVGPKIPSPLVVPPVVTASTTGSALVATFAADFAKLSADWSALNAFFTQPATQPVPPPPPPPTGVQTNTISPTPPASVPSQVLLPNTQGVGPYTVYVGASRPWAVLPSATTPGQFTYLAVAMSYAFSLNQLSSGQPGLDPVHFHFILDPGVYLNDFATYNNPGKWQPIMTALGWGTYPGNVGYSNWVGKLDFPCIIECVGGTATLQQSPFGPGSQLNQGGLIATGWDVTFRGLHFTGFTQDPTGADPGNLRGIAFESGHPPANFVIDHCEFDTCDDGWLGPSGGSSLYVSNTYTHNCGSGAGNTHNCYVDDAVWAVFDNFFSSNCNVGHLLKCRAAQTIIRNTVRLIGEANPAGTWTYGSPGSESACLDIPDAGVWTIEAGATLICSKSAASQAYWLIHYSGENQDAAGVPFHIPSAINIVGSLVMIGNATETVTVRGSSAAISGFVNQSGNGTASSGAASYLVVPTVSGVVLCYNIPSGNEGLAPVTVLASAPAVDLSNPAG